MHTELEKRKYKRFQFELDVRFTTNGRTGNPKGLIGKSIDISACGILIKTDKKLNVDEKLKLSFLMPNSFKFFKGSGKVVRTLEVDESWNTGIELIDVNTEGLRELNYYLRSDIGRKVP